MVPSAPKGQLNSEWIYDVIVSSKMPTKNFKDFRPRSLLSSWQGRNLSNFGRNDDIINSFWIQLNFKAYRLQSGWCSIILENVAVYQHFTTSEIQSWYNSEQERRKKEGGKPKYLPKKFRDRFKDRYVCTKYVCILWLL